MAAFDERHCWSARLDMAKAADRGLLLAICRVLCGKCLLYEVSSPMPAWDRQLSRAQWERGRRK